MGFSYSKVNVFAECPFKYKLRYLDNLKVRPDISPTNALYQGTACHTAIETRSIDEGLSSYKSNYKELSREHEIEIMKLKKAMEIAIAQAPIGEYEYKISCDDGFIGYIDILSKVNEDTYDIYDIKFSNNASGYKKSGQVHVYKYYFEKLTGKKIRNISYIMIPKFKDTFDSDIPLEDIEKRIADYYKDKSINIVPVDYDSTLVSYFLGNKVLMQKSKIFEKKYNVMCKFCDYQKYCRSNGKDKSEILIEEEESKEPEYVPVELF